MKSLHQKRIEAQQRKEDRSKRSDAQQLQMLQKRPGKSARELARLSKRIEVVGRADLTPAGEVAAPVVAVKTEKKKRLKKAA